MIHKKIFMYHCCEEELTDLFFSILQACIQIIYIYPFYELHGTDLMCGPYHNLNNCSLNKRWHTSKLETQFPHSNFLLKKNTSLKSMQQSSAELQLHYICILQNSFVSVLGIAKIDANANKIMTGPGK